MIPHTLSKAQVVSVNPDTNSVLVYLAQQAGEGPAVEVKVLTAGPCDGLRIKQAPLPTRGTLGVVAALDGDARSMIWLGALPLNAQDAITTLTGNNSIDYHAHWSGYYSLMDDLGNSTQVFPDGTEIVVGTANTPTRHIVGPQGTRQSVPVLPADRVAVTPGPFPFKYSSPAGATVLVDSAGNISVSGQTVNIWGATNINILGESNVNISAVTSINLTAPNVYINGNLSASGNVTVEGSVMATEDITTSDNSLSFVHHTHNGVQTGGGNTGPPNPGT